MKNFLHNLWGRFLNCFFIKHNSSGSMSKKENIIEAQQYLNEAYNRFNSILDPELIEIAILDIKVAEKRYDFLIREIKKQSEGNLKGGS